MFSGVSRHTPGNVPTPTSLEMALQVVAGVIMAALAALMVFLFFLAFFQCRPARAFEMGAGVPLLGCTAGATAAIRSPDNRVGWASLSSAFFALAGLFLFAATQVGVTCGNSGPIE
jgi:hypothetical protein